MPATIHAIDLNGDTYCGADRRFVYVIAGTSFGTVPADERCQDCERAILDDPFEVEDQ